MEMQQLDVLRLGLCGLDILLCLSQMTAVSVSSGRVGVRVSGLR